MEVITGAIKLKDLFRSHWTAFFLSFAHMILRPAIAENVMKLILCCSAALGFHLYECPKCGRQKKRPHSCKSRFCPSCGKKATEKWMRKAFAELPDCQWQHITFTMPKVLWEICQLNRDECSKQIPSIPAKLLLGQAKEKGILPGIYMAQHTFGRDLKYNLHFHLSVSMGGLTAGCKKWKKWKWTYRTTLKTRWRYAVIDTLRRLYKEGKLKLPNRHHICTYTQFNQWLDGFYQKNWVVHFAEPYDNHERTTVYMGRYLKRPPIAEARIKAYDAESITFEYLDHYTKEKAQVTLHVFEFMGRLIRHIPDKNYRMIRYYGFLSNRLRGKLLPLVHKLIGSAPEEQPYQKPLKWRQMFYQTFGYDPLKCYICDVIMEFVGAVYPAKKSWEQVNRNFIEGFT